MKIGGINPSLKRGQKAKRFGRLCLLIVLLSAGQTQAQNNLATFFFYITQDSLINTYGLPELSCLAEGNYGEYAIITMKDKAGNTLGVPYHAPANVAMNIPAGFGSFINGKADIDMNNLTYVVNEKGDTIPPNIRFWGWRGK